MEFLETVKIGAVVYKITISPENERWHEYNEEFGHIDYERREIAVSIANSFDQKRDTLVHEVVHGIVKHMGLREAWGDESEDYVKRLSNGLNMVFRDNPKFVKLLTQKGD